MDAINKYVAVSNVWNWLKVKAMKILDKKRPVLRCCRLPAIVWFCWKAIPNISGLVKVWYHLKTAGILADNNLGLFITQRVTVLSFHDRTDYKPFKILIESRWFWNSTDGPAPLLYIWGKNFLNFLSYYWKYKSIKLFRYSWKNSLSISHLCRDI